VYISAPLEWAACINDVIGTLQGTSGVSITINGATSTKTLTGYLEVDASVSTAFGLTIWTQTTLQYCGSGEPVTIYQKLAPC
jgi:hypothetical protein